MESRFFVESASPDALSTFYPEFSDFGDLAKATDIGFVGRIVGIEANIGADGPNLEDDSGVVITYDAIVFEVVEVLSGGELAPGDKITIAHPVLSDVPGQKGLENVPLRLEPIGLLKAGIEAKAGEGPRYLVFARRNAGSKGDGLFVPGGRVVYTFFGPGSVAPLAEDGHTVESTGRAPFIDMAGARNGLGYDITTEAVRDWIANGSPSISVPDAAKPKPGDDLNRRDE